ncbi:MAG: hypothetical protein LC649_02830, partial [Bacteroidales bacterium]|nr:hypothetical protein [Bacteroidales bacterium]
MNTRALFTLGLSCAVILFGSFMVREREEALNTSPDYYLLQGDKSFSVFVSNLQKMEALIYVPKSKLADVKAFNLALVPKMKAGKFNKAMAGSTGDYVQVYPSDGVSEAVSLGFEKLGMVCYVKQEKVNARAMDMFSIKFEKGKVFPKVESVGINAVRPEELQIKW